MRRLVRLVLAVVVAVVVSCTGYAGVVAKALDGVPVAMGRFPVLVLEPGMGLSAPQYTALADHGGPALSTWTALSSGRWSRPDCVRH